MGVWRHLGEALRDTHPVSAPWGQTCPEPRWQQDTRQLPWGEWDWRGPASREKELPEDSFRWRTVETWVKIVITDKNRCRLIWAKVLSIFHKEAQPQKLPSAHKQNSSGTELCCRFTQVDVGWGRDVSSLLPCLRDTTAAWWQHPHTLSLSLKGCENVIGSVWVCILSLRNRELIRGMPMPVTFVMNPVIILLFRQYELWNNLENQTFLWSLSL